MRAKGDREMMRIFKLGLTLGLLLPLTGCWGNKAHTKLSLKPLQYGAMPAACQPAKVAQNMGLLCGKERANPFFAGEKETVNCLQKDLQKDVMSQSPEFSKIAMDEMSFVLFAEDMEPGFGGIFFRLEDPKDMKKIETFLMAEENQKNKEVLEFKSQDNIALLFFDENPGTTEEQALKCREAFKASVFKQLSEQAH